MRSKLFKLNIEVCSVIPDQLHLLLSTIDLSDRIRSVSFAFQNLMIISNENIKHLFAGIGRNLDYYIN